MSQPWWEKEFAVQSASRRAAHLSRELRVVPAGVMDAASNDYLGLSRHPGVLRAACEAVLEFGAGARASRLVSGHNTLHAQLENALAHFKGHEAALLFPSGYHANLGVVTALAPASTLLCCDKRNHASLVDACLLAGARGANVRFYEGTAKLRALLRRHSGGSTLVVSDAVYSMDGDLAPVPELLEIVRQFDALLILDDAHGNGTLGEGGRGALEYFGVSPVENRLPVVEVGTLSKALGAQGGFVCGSASLIEGLVNVARPFIYTTALNPASCGAALAALQIIEREPQRMARLRAVKSRLSQGLSTLGLPVREQPSPIIPLLLGDEGLALQFSWQLLARGVWCPAIRPPTVARHTSRLRLTACAAWSDEVVERILAAFTAL